MGQEQIVHRHRIGRCKFDLRMTRTDAGGDPVGLADGVDAAAVDQPVVVEVHGETLL